MDFDWRNYLTLAQELVQQRPSPLNSSNLEARYRAALSRAYYAVYHLASHYLEIHGPYFSGLGISRHGDVYNQFLAGPTDEHMEFGNALLKLYNDRINSDYEPDNSWLTSSNVAFSISSASQLVEALNSIKKLDSAAKKQK